MKYLCSQCDNWMDEPEYTGRVISTRVGTIEYTLCSYECLKDFYREVILGITGKDIYE